ncbi:MAG: hypothetical protein IJU98_05570 [Synergistaceae bacterium]|nr:hypothetical protein [Synergistaceae bacterium]
MRSLSAVWNEIPDKPEVDREGTLILVARRLFAGYEIEIVRDAGKGPVVSFASRQTTDWNASLTLPDLRELADGWFQKDAQGMEEEILTLLRPLPGAALTWADSALKEVLASIVERRFPGWDFSVQVALGEAEGIVTLSFRPKPPLILAITPSLYSRTIPAMFQSDLEAKLIPAFSSLIGLPVAWAVRHRSDVEEAARFFLEDRHTVENLRARANVIFLPGPVSGLDARVDSDRFRFQVWVAAYAGLDGRYPEAGVFLGWNTAHITGIDLELYGEAVAELDDLGLTRRLGGRFELFDNFWAGAEMEWPGEFLFWRVQWGPARARRPYLWWRWNPDAGHEGAVGYRVDEHISVEIYYDGTGSDNVGLRGLWAL